MNNTTYTVKEFIIYILRKWWAVALAVLLLAGILGGPKLKNNTTEKNATVIISKIVMIENNAKIVDQNTNIQKYEDYSDMWMRDTSLSVFFSQASQQFDMEKLAVDWDPDNLTSQIKWFKNQVICKTIPNTAKYEFHLTLAAGESNYDYVHENGQKFLDAFVDYVTGLSQTEVPEIRSVVLNSSNKEIPAASGSSAAKYMILGGLLGGILSVFILGVCFLGSRKIVSKNMLLGKFDIDSIDHTDRLDYDIFCYFTAQSRKSGRKSFVLSSSLQDYTRAEQIIARFTACGYRVAVANITGKPVKLTGDVLSGEELKELSKPGNTAAALARLSEKTDFLLILSDMPATDPVVTELIENSACGVFIEKIYVSSKKIVERSMMAVHAYAPESPVCIAWEK